MSNKIENRKFPRSETEKSSSKILNLLNKNIKRNKRSISEGIAKTESIKVSQVVSKKQA